MSLVTTVHAARDLLGFSVLSAPETSGRRCTLGYTLINIDKEDEPSEKSYWKLWLLLLLALLIVGFLHWGGYLPVAVDSVPEHVDAAVVLQRLIRSRSAGPRRGK